MTDDTAPVRYIDRTRAYYRALGYAKDYVWSTYHDVPFTPLAKPLADSRIGLVTTASAGDPAAHGPGYVRRVWSGPVAPPPQELFTANLAWDKESTHTRDRESFLPIETVSALVGEGRVGGLAAHFHGVPTEYSQRKTIDDDAPQVLRRLRDDGADAAILCPL